MEVCWGGDVKYMCERGVGVCEGVHASVAVGGREPVGYCEALHVCSPEMLAWCWMVGLRVGEGLGMGWQEGQSSRQ